VGPTLNLECRASWLLLYRLLEKMAPWQRTRWLVQCCKLASHGVEPITLTECKGEVDECWATYRIICGQGRLTADRAGSVASKILGG
jgi:hypothetical protein